MRWGIRMQNMLGNRKILVIGPGAIGLSLAAWLQRAGNAVHVLGHRTGRCEQPHEVTICTQGMEFSEKILVSSDPSIVSRCSHVIICVKAYATERVAQNIAPHVLSQTQILSLQNGLGNRTALEHFLPHRRNIRIGVVLHGAFRKSPSTIITTSPGQIQIAGSVADPVLIAWQTCLKQAGCGMDIKPDEGEMVWSKAVINAVINPVTALYNLRNGELPLHDQAWKLACNILAECIHIARSAGVDLDEGTMQQTLMDICQRTAANFASMLMDIRTGRPTEIDQINGAILRKAHDLDLDAPHNTKIIESIQKRCCMNA
jgi:2-dehydropantoate 2-reductase